MRGQVLACAEQHLGDVPGAIGSHKKPRLPGEGKENLACRKAAPFFAEQADVDARAGTPQDRRLPKRSSDSIEVSRGPRCRDQQRRPDICVMPTERQQPRIASPARGRRPIRRLNRAGCSARSETGVGLHRHTGPSGAPNGDGAKHGERLPPPFRREYRGVQGQGSHLAGVCRRNRE